MSAGESIQCIAGSGAIGYSDDCICHRLHKESQAASCKCRLAQSDSRRVECGRFVARGAVRTHARSRASFLRSRDAGIAGACNVASFLEVTRNAPLAEPSRGANLATAFLESRVAPARELCSEVGLRAAESSARGINLMRGRLAIPRRNARIALVSRRRDGLCPVH